MKFEINFKNLVSRTLEFTPRLLLSETVFDLDRIQQSLKIFIAVKIGMTILLVLNPGGGTWKKLKIDVFYYLFI